MYITVCCDYLTLLTLLKPLDPDPNAEDPLIRIRNTAGQFAVLKIWIRIYPNYATQTICT